jgi:hypothetical protein
MNIFSVKNSGRDGNCIFRGLATLLKTVVYYFVLRCIIAEANIGI